MPKQTELTIRTRHINCFYCIALAFFLLSIILFALSAKQDNALGNDQSRIPVIITASIILLFAVIIVIWITYYAVGYFRLKKHAKLNRKAPTTIQSNQTSTIIFDNAAFTIDDPLSLDTATRTQTSA